MAPPPLLGSYLTASLYIYASHGRIRVEGRHHLEGVSACAVRTTARSASGGLAARLLRHRARQVRRRDKTRANRHRTQGGRRAENRRKLSTAMPRARRRGIRKLQVPPNHSAVHVPGRGLHRRQRTRRTIHLRTHVRRRKLHLEAHGIGNPIHGERWAEHKRKPVLHMHRGDAVARR